jgi:hypothetical protein
VCAVPLASSPSSIASPFESRGPLLRQWHLDLIMLGGLMAAASRYVPNAPRTVSVPLAVGAWVNANAVGVLAFRAELKTIASTRRVWRCRSRQRRGVSRARSGGLKALVEAAMNKQGDIR